MPQCGAASNAGSKHSTLAAARAYVAAGISVVPIARDGSKRPALKSWDAYKGHRGAKTGIWVEGRLPTQDELREWFDRPDPFGVGTVCGKVSGNLELIDFDLDAAATFPAFRELAERLAPGLLDRVNVVRTPRAGGGYHLRYRYEVPVPASFTLARRLVSEGGESRRAVLIETRGEGGQALAPGCPPECHPSGGLYRHHAGPRLSEVPTITASEREALIAAARALNELDPADDFKKDPPGRGPRDPRQGLSPGDDFCARGTDWPDLLPGWEFLRQRGDTWLVRRPGKASGGWSATVGFCKQRGTGFDYLYVFSSNAPPPFEPERCYTKFGVYGLLQHGGDFKAAARDLAAKGYGSEPSVFKGRAWGDPAGDGTHHAGTNGDGAGPDGAKADGPAAGAGGEGHAEAPPDGLTLDVVTLSTIKPRPVSWLVPGYFPRSKLILLAGPGGHGKSTLTLDLAACLTTGRACLGLDYAPEKPCDVLLISCEDGVEDTITPRLDAVKADRGRVHHVRGVRNAAGKVLPFNLTYLAQVRALVRCKPEIRLVVIDPAGAFIGGRADEHKDAELREVLDPMAALADEIQLTFLLLKHTTKTRYASAVNRVMGSVGWVNLVRAAYLVGADEQDEETKYLVPMKFNIGPKPAGLAYRCESLDRELALRVVQDYGHLNDFDRDALARQMFRVRWAGTTERTADSLGGGEEGPRRGGPKRLDQCAEFLRVLLQVYAYPSREVTAIAGRCGFNFDSVKDAKAKLTAEGVLASSNLGRFQGVWWVGLGRPETWKLRPEPGAGEGSPNTPHFPHFGTNSDGGEPLSDDDEYF